MTVIVGIRVVLIATFISKRNRGLNSDMFFNCGGLV